MRETVSRPVDIGKWDSWEAHRCVGEQCKDILLGFV
jgi:hypothetical protein